MTPHGFVARVALESAVALGLLALAGAWFAGSSGAVGVIAGGGLAVGNLWWLGRRAAALAPEGCEAAARRPSMITGAAALGARESARWWGAAVLRFALIAATVALALASGLAHPVAVVIGLTVLPFVVVARGLALARPGGVGEGLSPWK